MHALQSGIFSGTRAGDRDLPIVPANFLKLLHSYVIISFFAALGWEL